MKLSEAIRLGAMQFPPQQGGSMRGAGRCALGAAGEALGIPAQDTGEVNYAEIVRRYPFVANVAPCPVCDICDISAELVDLVWHLNDCHNDDGWTRERIAAWVETYEPEQLETTGEADAAILVTKE